MNLKPPSPSRLGTTQRGATRAPDRSGRRGLVDAAAPTLILLTLLAAFLKYHRYPFLTPEVFLCALALSVLGLTLCWLASLRRETLYPLIVGLLIVAFFDAQFLVIHRFATWPASLSGGVRLILFVLGFWLFMFLVFAVRRVAGQLVSAVFGAMLLATILLPAGQIPAGESVNQNDNQRRDLPLILHLVLDEQIGLAGIPRSISGGEELRRDIAKQFLESGFTIYERAFSHYSESQFSLASLVNGEVFSSSVDYITGSPLGYKIRRNDWLNSLAATGRSVRVYESGWIDFCDASGFQPDYCYTYPTNSVASLLEFDLDALTKTRLILPRVFNGSLNVFPWHEPQLSSLSALKLLGRVAEDIRSHPRGTAFFVHLMLPHYAYLFDRECRVRSDIDTWVNVGNLSSRSNEFNTEEERTTKYGFYFAQVRCLMSSLNALFQEIERMGALDGATIIVHGDHGSRLARKPFRLVDLAELTESDMTDLFSTFFAIRVQDGPVGSIPEQTSLQEAFALMMLHRPLKGPTTEVFTRPPSGSGKFLVGRPMVRLD